MVVAASPVVSFHDSEPLGSDKKMTSSDNNCCLIHHIHMNLVDIHMNLVACIGYHNYLHSSVVAGHSLIPE